MKEARRFLVLFISVGILLTGHGLQLTLLPLRAEGLGWTINEIGMTGSFYFAGFLAGCLLIPRFVAGVGHVRTFSTTTTLCGAALLMILVTDEPAQWSLFRFVSGVGISGSYLIIESWLNEMAPSTQRSRILAIYSVIVLLGMSIGQLLISTASPSGVGLVVMASLLLSLSVLPVSLMTIQQPAAGPRVEFALRKVYRASPAAVGAVFAIGAVTGLMFTMTPVLGRQAALDDQMIGLLMIAMVVGGAVFQYPIGHFSDRYDRRHVVVVLMIAGVSVSLIAGWMAASPWWLVGCLFALGGIANTIYPICLAHANDRAPNNFLQIGTIILLVNSAGAAIGPMVGSVAMDELQAAGYFVAAAVGMLLTLGWVVICIVRHQEAPATMTPFTSVTKSTQGILAADPRAVAESSATIEANAEHEPTGETRQD